MPPPRPDGSWPWLPAGHGCQRPAVAALLQCEAGVKRCRPPNLGSLPDPPMAVARALASERERCQPPNLGRMSDVHDSGNPMTIEPLAAAVLTTLLCGATDTAASRAGRSIGLHREMPHPGVGLGHRHNRTGLQGVGVGFEDGEEPAEHPLRPHVPQPEDDDARSRGAGNGNQVREVEVVGD